jgi:hypothetical protein
MKYKLSFIIMALSISALTFGQTDSLGSSKKVHLVSKRGVSILPAKGEIALGIDAWPIFYYLGGIFSNNDATPPSFDAGTTFGNLYGIYGKYMLKSDLAIRAKFRCDFNSNTDIFVVPKSTLTYDPMAPEFVDDQITYNNNIVQIGIGIEKMRGASRVQGKYGAEAVFGYEKFTTKYNYGNSITNEFNRPETFNDIYYNGAERMLNDYVDKGLFLGARGFVGIEFFIGPKISLGGEFGYSLVYQWSQNRTVEYEYWNSSLQEVSTVIRKSDNTGYDDVLLGIDNLDGEINLFFYF